MKRGGAERALKAALSGALAGGAGTAAMDLVWFARYRRGGGTQKFLAWETAEGVDTWAKASDPGHVGQRLVERITGHKLPDRWARSMTNLVHWMTGLGWGAQFGLVNCSARRRHLELALLFGPAVWLARYAILPIAKVYKPIWEYDARALAKDFSAHIAYGTVTAATFSALTYRRARG